MSASLITITVIGTVAVIGLAFFFAFIDKIIKGDVKVKVSSKPKEEKKEVKPPEPVAEVMPKKKNEEEDDDDEPDKKDKENNVESEKCDGESFRARRIHEYYKRRWGDTSFSLLTPEDVEDPDDEGITKEDAAKLVALRNLFDKK